MKGFAIILIAALFVSCSSSKKLTTSQKKAKIYYTHGTQKLIEKNYTEALKHLIQAHRLDSKDSRILNNLGMAYFLKGRQDLALEYIKEAVELDNKNSDARNNLASIYLKQGSLNKAKEQYEKVLGDLLYTNQYRVHYNLGLIEERKGNIDLAIKNYEKAAGMRIDYCAANYKLATSYQKTGKIANALNWYKKSVRGNCENNVQPFYDWANLLIKMGKNNEAIEKLDYIVEKFPNKKVSVLAARKKRILEKKMALTSNRVDSNIYNSGDF